MTEDYAMIDYGWRVPKNRTSHYGMTNTSPLNNLVKYGEKTIRYLALINAIFNSTSRLDSKKLTHIMDNFESHVHSLLKPSISKDFSYLMENEIHQLDEVYMLAKKGKVSLCSFMVLYRAKKDLKLKSNPILDKRYVNANKVLKILSACRYNLDVNHPYIKSIKYTNN